MPFDPKDKAGMLDSKVESSKNLAQESKQDPLIPQAKIPLESPEVDEDEEDLPFFLK